MLKIGTHNGMFHADDLLAVALLKLIYPDAEIVRTRDAKTLDECDIVVDVAWFMTIVKSAMIITRAKLPPDERTDHLLWTRACLETLRFGIL